jgi:hypothetical protein
MGYGKIPAGIFRRFQEAMEAFGFTPAFCGIADFFLQTGLLDSF